MSVFSSDIVHSVAEATGLSSLSSDVASAVAQDMEYRIREVIQEAKKFMRHSRRLFLTIIRIRCTTKSKI
jgi:transcription initiation factor TFIID subunit 6